MRRTIISVMCVAVAIVFAASCNKAEDNPTSSERTIITAVAEAIGGDSKAHNQYSYDVLWDEGDRIYVTGGGKSNTFTVSDESAGTNKGKFTEDTPSYGIKGDIEAFYPANLKDGNDYVWPAIQTNNPVPPMYARQTISGDGDETVSFSSLGAVLQIVFNSTTPDITITSVTIKDAAKPLSGKFTVDNNGQAIIDDGAENVGITLNPAGAGVEMGKSAKYFYIAIPAGKYKGDEFTLTFKDSNSGVECVMKSTSLPDIARNTVGRITLSGSFKDKVPAGALPGKFTVDMEGKQVFFSKGNLQATWHSATDSYSWGFADKQTDIVGIGPGNTTIGSQEDGSVVSLFGWSTAATYYGIATSTERDEYPGDFVDWGTAYCKEHNISPNDTWRTLSTNEWQYLLQHNKHGFATVKYETGKTIGGLVIAPDDFEGTVNSIYEAYHLSEFNLVFLPAESSRDGLKVYDNIGTNGHYHSSTQITGYSTFDLYFYDGKPNPIMSTNRNSGSSVRLVTDVNYIPEAQRRYTVSFYPQKGVAPDPVMVNAGATFARPEDPSLPDYVLEGWYKDFSCTLPWDFDNDIVTRDIVLFPDWKEAIPAVNQN